MKCKNKSKNPIDAKFVLQVAPCLTQLQKRKVEERRPPIIYSMMKNFLRNQNLYAKNVLSLQF